MRSDLPENNLLFYFNGFNSAIQDDYSGSPKIVAVAEYACRRGFSFMPVSIDFRRASIHTREILDSLTADLQRVVFCGSSMGGWFARMMQLLLIQARPCLRVEALTFNPAFDLGSHGHLLVGPQLNYVTLEEYDWTEEHSRQLKRLEDSVDYDSPVPFFVYVDKGDEVIDWQLSAARHAPISQFHAFEGGCHSFAHFSEALLEFDKACPPEA